MPYANSGAGDFEKLRLAASEIASTFGSVEDILEAIGLSDLPVAQRYGILFGCFVFTGTIVSVGCLLIYGGTFKRIADQEKTGRPSVLSSHEERANRALLLEDLLDGRERMQLKYGKAEKTKGLTELTKMLLNVAPAKSADRKSGTDNTSPRAIQNISVEEQILSPGIPTHDQDNLFLVLNSLERKSKSEDRKSGTDNTSPRTIQNISIEEQIRDGEVYIPPHYQDNYAYAYRRCQDRPGGAPLPGSPEARFEAYARGFAGCGAYPTKTYRRSYGRMYEAICCSSHVTEKKYEKLFQERPYDVIGKFVRLEALEVDRHLSHLWHLTSGEGNLLDNTKPYDPSEVWSFLPDGPFKDEQRMAKSFVFQRDSNEASFGIVDSVTDRLLGAVILRHDDPSNLSIQLEPPIMAPFKSNDNDGVKLQMEACYLLLDRLFAYGYRRIQISCDSQDDGSRKFAERLGFTFEGVLFKHLILKDSSRDSNMYGMLNSDWKKGARNALFQRLYGKKALRADLSNEKKEEEWDAREEFSQVDKEQEQSDSVATGTNEDKKNV